MKARVLFYITRIKLLWRLRKKVKYSNKDYNLEEALLKNIVVGSMVLVKNRFGKLEFKEWMQVIEVSGNHVHTIDRYGAKGWWYVAYIIKFK